MRMAGTCRWWLPVAAALLPLTAAGAQTRYKLVEGHAVGDLSVEDNSLSMTMELKIQAGGQEFSPGKVVRRDRDRYTTTVVALDARGRPSEVRRVYEVATRVDAQPGEEPQERDSPLKGRTVTVKRVGEKVVVTVDKGELSDEDRQNLERSLDRGDQRFFPDKEVEVGESWTVDVKDAGTVFPGAKRARVTGKIVEVLTYRKHRCARIELAIELEGQPEGAAVDLTMNLKGNLYYALDLRRSISFEASGPVVAKGSVEQQGTTAEFQGQGTMEVKLVSDWRRVGGKAVAP